MLARRFDTAVARSKISCQNKNVCARKLASTSGDIRQRKLRDRAISRNTTSMGHQNMKILNLKIAAAKIIKRSAFRDIGVQISTVIALLLATAQAHATNFEFKSPLDRFEIEVTDGLAYFQGQPVDEEPFAAIQTLFNSEIPNACPPALGKPDLTITRKMDDSEPFDKAAAKGSSSDKRVIYLKKRQVSDGTNCIDIKGNGVYLLPQHRNWFTGLKKASIIIKNSFKIVKDERTVVEFERTPTGWRNKDPQLFTNWVFFEKFLDILNSFPINYRVDLDAAKSLTSFELHTGDKVFMFVKVANKTWAVKQPQSVWLTASGNFGIFEDMKPEMWISPYEKTLRMITDARAPVEKRVQAVRALVDNWGPDIKYAFHGVLLNEAENARVRREIVLVLRNYPSDDNFRVLAYALKATNDGDLLFTLTKTLRIRNPKGPVIEENDADDVIQQKITAWMTWAKTLK